MTFRLDAIVVIIMRRYGLGECGQSSSCIDYQRIPIVAVILVVVVVVVEILVIVIVNIGHVRIVR